jgi:hypothetical protein
VNDAFADDVVVVRYKFGLPHALVLTCIALALVAAWSGSRIPDNTVVAREGLNALAAAEILRVDDSLTLADAERLRDVLAESVVVEQATPEEYVRVDPQVDADFAALDPSKLKQLEGFLSRYRHHAYAKAQGYIGQVDDWRQSAKWREDDERLRKKQNSVEWIHD